MKRSSCILTLCLGAALLGACTKQSLQATYDKQSTYIESFVSATLQKDEEATLTRNGGACRIVLHDNLPQDRDSLQPGGKVALYYACFILNSGSTTFSPSALVATNLKALAEQAGWELSDESIYKLDTLTLDKALLPGLRDGLEGVQEEDEGYILFTGQYAFGNVTRGTIPARSALAYYYLIDSIDNE